MGNYLVAPLWEWQEQQQEKEEEEGNESVGGTTGRVPSGHGDVFTLYGFAMLLLWLKTILRIIYLIIYV